MMLALDLHDVEFMLFHIESSSLWDALQSVSESFLWFSLRWEARD